MQKIKAIAKNTANNLFRKTESEKSVFLIVVFLPENYFVIPLFSAHSLTISLSGSV